MKKYSFLFCAFIFTACVQCSKPKKVKTTQNKDDIPIEKTIKTIIIYADYSPESITIKEKDYREYFQWAYEEYCYKTPKHYPEFHYPYKGNIIDGYLVAKVYKKDGSFVKIQLTTYKDDINLNRGVNPRNWLNVHIYIPYSGEENRLEVRRINEKKNENVLLFEKKIGDFNSVDWGKHENERFNAERYCHRSKGSR